MNTLNLQKRRFKTITSFYLKIRVSTLYTNPMKEVFLGSSCVYTLNTDITSVQKLDYVYYICVYTLNTEITGVHNLLKGYYMFLHLEYLCQKLQVDKTWLQV